MAEADPEHSCHFRWVILHPFTPWHRLNATFFDGSPTVTRWKVTLQPLRRTINSWTFEFSLEFDRSLDERAEIVANKVEVNIFINNTYVTDEEVSHFRFIPSNFFTYRFETEVNMCTELNPHLLVVAITLHLPGEAAVDQYNNDRDIMDLSNDLRQLRLEADPMFSNMRLRSADGSIRNVHSCIIWARWNNFYRLNPFSAGSADAVQTNISFELLDRILMYLYSGLVAFPETSGPLFFTELFQVINRYKLYHLYKILVQNDLHQRLTTARHVVTVTRNFPLTNVLGNPNNTFSQPWLVNRHTHFKSLFTIQVQIWNGPWLAYSLRSLSRILIHAQVNLDIGKRVVETPGTEARTSYLPVHQWDYTILPSAVIDSGAELFLGCSETFGDSNPVNRHGQRREVEYFVRCTLKFTDGWTFYEIHSSDTTLRNDRENVNLLVDHLLELRRTLFDADLRILPRSESENQPTQQFYYSTEIHKVIFAARVRLWREVFTDVRPDKVPDVATSILSSEALLFVLNYIYTSRGFPFPQYLLDEITRFASNGHCHSLLRAINDFDWPDE